MTPRLTIGIPTQGKRPGRLEQAIGSALAQTVPARVIVANQGDVKFVRDVCGKYQRHSLVECVPTRATCLWENWLAAASAAQTEFFAWLQDDDLLAPHFTARVESAFDAFPKARTWMARLGISYGARLANWWQATGPMVPMDLLHGIPSEVRSDLMVVGAYFTSHALSPGVAFRRDSNALDVLQRIPNDLDLFAERLVLAQLATLGPGVCDPAIVGYWCHHESNESRALNLSGDGPRQFRAMLESIDQLLTNDPRFYEWRETLRGWATLVGRDTVGHWLRHTAAYDQDSKLLEAARTILTPFGIEADAASNDLSSVLGSAA